MINELAEVLVMLIETNEELIEIIGRLEGMVDNFGMLIDVLLYF